MKKILDKLNKKHSGAIEFKKASIEVFLKNIELTPNTTHSFGNSVAISTLDTYKPALEDLITGKNITVGSSEKLKYAQLKCLDKGEFIGVGLYMNDSPIGMELKYSGDKDKKIKEIDEGLFTWFSPEEYIGTPFSDSDPTICQVITIDFLRDWGNTIERLTTTS